VENKSWFGDILSQLNFCKESSESVDEYQNYSMPHQCRFFRDIVYNCDTGSKLVAAHLRISSGSLHLVIEHGLPLPFTLVYTVHTQSEQTTLEARSTYHRVSGGGVGLGGVGVGPAEHIASKLNHSTLQAQTHS